MSWSGFMVITKESSAYLQTMRGCALQAYQAGLDQEIYKDSRDAARKEIIIAYVQIERKDK